MAVVALVAWWSSDAYWLSDDFLAITYAHDPGRVLRDFVGPQYGATGMVWLYRPLITLSFALDAWLGGGAPWVSHASNLLAHGTSAALVAALGTRLLGTRPGCAAGLLWAVWPAHAGSILWAVGRVDSHTTVWILLSLWLTVRWLDGGSRTARVGALLAFTAALLSKELALATPGLVALLGLALGTPRMRSAVRTALPFALLLIPYFAWRYVVLGRLVGGYDDASFALGPALAGLGIWTARLANPWFDLPGRDSAGWLAWLGFVPILLGVGLAIRAGRGRVVVLLAMGYLVAALPTLPFWAAVDDPKNLRYLYLPAACLLGIVALGGPVAHVLAMVMAILVLLGVRDEYRLAHRAARAVHTTLRSEAAALPPGPLFVSGLQRENERHSVLLFHLWVDRLCAPPFGDGRRLFALRPLAERAGVLRVPFGVDAGLDEGSTLALGHGDSPPRRLAPVRLPRFAITTSGPAHIDNDVLWDLHRDLARLDLQAAGVRAPWLRLTLFTAGGYLSSVVRNETPDGSDAQVSLKTWLTARYATDGDDAFVLLALPVPTLFDLEPVFPLLVEAGDLSGDDPHTFAPTAQAERLVWLRFERDLIEYVKGRAPERPR